MPQFLSDDWIAAARQIRTELEAEGRLPDPGPPSRLNLNITEVPFGAGTVQAHVDTVDGVEIELGHLDTADATITLGYATAQSIFVAGDSAAAMQAFMSNQLKIDGDMTKVMALQTQMQGTDFKPLQERFLAITD